jgi:hypothetical protein
VDLTPLVFSDVLNYYWEFLIIRQRFQHDRHGEPCSSGRLRRLGLPKHPIEQVLSSLNQQCLSQQRLQQEQASRLLRVGLHRLRLKLLLQQKLLRLRLTKFQQQFLLRMPCEQFR